MNDKSAATNERWWRRFLVASAIQKRGPHIGIGGGAGCEEGPSAAPQDDVLVIRIIHEKGPLHRAAGLFLIGNRAGA
ncbi:hypothetical protein EJV47_09730 [Hymenobacter gummosus]|uniref:Uncharacterized protein n=1 Tax=Hymenobacter gummosus TaxID=1776032 RepID=A0A3S0JBH9_9BACT|nr:hypothetical protein [Hymenobacter gummosus]RTQ50884.1 hypothetical protein EJV47_09730 [Hymenobacter gummosus]